MFARAALALVLCAAPMAGAQQLPVDENQRIADHVGRVLRERMRTCWQMPTSVAEDDRLVVTVRFELSEDGTLAEQPRVVEPRNHAFDPSMREAVTAALRAVRACAPYTFADDPVTANHYEVWRELEMTFRPGFNRADR